MPDRFQINIAARRTGLSTHVIRVWERRYGAIKPERTPTKRRLYSIEEINRLILLRRVTLQGHAISRVANLSDNELEQLTRNESLGGKRPKSVKRTPNRTVVSPDEYVALCLADIENLEATAFEDRLNQAAVDLGQQQMLEKLVMPLLHEIGRKWREGELRVVHEHLASAVLRGFLSHVSSSYLWNPDAPHLIVTTPVGHFHEFGALIVSAIAAAEGWRVTYLGPNLPAEEIALMAQRSGAQAVALSLIFTAQDQIVGEELRRLRSVLPRAVRILAGGQGALDRRELIEQLGIELVEDLVQLRQRLNLSLLRTQQQ